MSFRLDGDNGSYSFDIPTKIGASISEEVVPGTYIVTNVKAWENPSWNRPHGAIEIEPEENRVTVVAGQTTKVRIKVTLHDNGGGIL